MKKLQIDLPEDVVDAITEEGVREFRKPEQQASYLLLLWSREALAKHAKPGKAPLPATGNGHGTGTPKPDPAFLST